MKRFAGFLYKEIYHIIRDMRTLIVLIGMPVVQLLLFGYVLTNEIKDAKIAILDHSKDEVTSELTQKFLSSGYFKLSRELQSENEINTLFQEGDIKEVIVFEEDFARKFEKDGNAKIQIINDASEPNTANLLVNY